MMRQWMLRFLAILPLVVLPALGQAQPNSPPRPATLQQQGTFPQTEVLSKVASDADLTLSAGVVEALSKEREERFKKNCDEAPRAVRRSPQLGRWKS